jgi:hypothetical protein
MNKIFKRKRSVLPHRPFCFLAANNCPERLSRPNGSQEQCFLAAGGQPKVHLCEKGDQNLKNA